MRPFFIIWFILVLLSHSCGAASDDKCAASSHYECPHLSDLCNTTLHVNDCLADCEGYRNTDPNSKVCFDRQLLNKEDNPEGSGLWWRDAIGIVVWFCAAGIATACGVGGGGIYVPLGILLLHFAPKPSSGLSQASIFGASLGGLLLNARNRHPFTTQLIVKEEGDENKSVRQVQMTSISTQSKTATQKEDNSKAKYYVRPLIDFDMALFLAPMEMAGAVLGVLIQKILPNWLYLTLAAIILGFTAYKTYNKFRETRKEEKVAAAQEEPVVNSEHQEHSKHIIQDKESQGTAEKTEDSHHEPIQEALVEEDSSPPVAQLKNLATGSVEQETVVVEASQPAAPPSVEEEVADNDNENDEIEDANNNPQTAPMDVQKLERCQYWLEKDQRQFPPEKVMGLLVLWIGLILLTFFKGGKGVDSIVGITCASPWFGVLIAIQFAWTFGIAALYGYKLLKATQDKQDCGYPFHPQDVLWDMQKIRFYSFFTFVAGIVAGLIGIGGGMVLGPLMLVMGIHPRVSSATTATMIVLTSSSVAVLFVTAGLVPWEYAITFFCVCFTGACMGKTKIDGYVKRTGKASLLILLLAIIIALATLGCLVIVFTRLAAADWCFAGINKFCSISEDEDEEFVCPDHRMLSLFEPTD